MITVRADGLTRAGKYYAQYGVRARELKDQGRKSIGYLSALGPVEVITAAGLIPVRLKGDVNESITKADAHMETIVCPFVRKVFDAVLKGKYEYLDGIVIPHLCDSTSRTYDTWRYNVDLPYSHFLNVPHVTDDPSVEFFKAVLRVFMKSLEKLTGRTISDETLRTAVKAHNHNRQKMRELYDLRKVDPPLVSGAEMTRVLVAAMSLPVEESTALIDNVTKEMSEKAASPDGKRKRIMLVGDQIDDVVVTDIIEKACAWLVMDDTSIGSKMYWGDVDVTPDPMQGIAERYLRKLPLPTTYVGSEESYLESLEARFGHIRKFVDEFKIDGVILFIYKYCDPYGFEVPAMKSFIESSGTPVLYLEDEYSASAVARLKTRIEAFLEMIA